MIFIGKKVSDKDQAGKCSVKKIVLIVTSSFDKTVDYIIERFPDKAFLRLDVDRLERYGISVHTINGSVCVRYDDGNVRIENLFDKVDAIYYRKVFLPNLHEYDEKYHTFMQKELYGFIVGLVDSFEGKVLTKPSILRKVENKVYQLSLAEKLAIPMPESIIGNDAAFVEQHRRGQWVAKPLTSGKLTGETIVQTNLLTESVGNIGLSPTYFQRYERKDYELRITVVDDEFYCVKIEAANPVDWRENEHENLYELVETSPVIREECKRFMQECELRFGCFDYIVRGDEHFFLECNPNGQWGWLEMELGLDISDKIVRYLYA